MTSAVESVLRRDRVIVLAGLAALVLAAWLYIVRLAREMAEMELHAAMGMVMSPMQRWGGVDLLLLFAMWAAMMIAMMTPSASPMILMFAAINRRRAEAGGPVVRTGVFALGYLVMWTAYSGVAALAQWMLHGLALMSPMMVSTSPYLGGGLLVAAGAFQWTPLKQACLVGCRSPVGFIMTEWRAGGRGAFIMGLRHGLYCVGCCGVLMALLLVAGVMNLLWVAILAVFVLVEKVVPGGERLGRVTGAVLVAAGLAMMLRG